MAELFTEDGTYRNVPVYDNFEYIADNKYDGWTTLSPVWTTSGLLIPISHSDTPAYMRIPRKECIKMIADLLDLNTFRKILESVNKKQNKE